MKGNRDTIRKKKRVFAITSFLISIMNLVESSFKFMS